MGLWFRMSIVSLESVNKFFGSRQVLHNLSFTVRPGEIVGLLGPNGSGKTTTLRLVAGYYEPDQGRVSFSGGARPSVGYLPERAPLYDALTVTQYLGFVGRCKGLSGKALAQGIERSIHAFNLESVRSTAIGRLSKGFRQRVGLGQAILADPGILLLDEATNGLDPIQIIEAREMIRAQAQCRAVIFSSHLMQEVQALCTRALILRHGRLIADVPLVSTGQAGSVVLELQWRGAESQVLAQALARLPGVVGTPTVSLFDAGVFTLAVAFQTQPDTIDPVLAVAMREGQVLQAHYRSTHIEDLLIEAVRRSDSLTEALA